MSKYLKFFESESDYDDWVASNDHVIPNVCVIGTKDPYSDNVNVSNVHYEKEDPNASY